MKRSDPEFVKRLVELADGDSWDLADLLVDQFPVEEYGAADRGRNSGLYEELRRFELELTREHGIELKANTMRLYRTTAIAWPDDTRVSSASFSVHRVMSGPNRHAEMKLRLRQAEKEGRALSKTLLRRFRADDKPAKVKPFEEYLRSAIVATVRRMLLGGIVTKREDWWMVPQVNDEARALVVRELRALANAINRGPIDDG
jgi:hypothetical protein